MSYKQKLESLREELQGRIDKIDKDFHNRQSNSKFSEQVINAQNDDVLHNLKNEAMYELEQIQRALTKLEQGNYGHCEKCHADISPERLDTLPYATHCKECAA